MRFGRRPGCGCWRSVDNGWRPSASAAAQQLMRRLAIDRRFGAALAYGRYSVRECRQEQATTLRLVVNIELGTHA